LVRAADQSARLARERHFGFLAWVHRARWLRQTSAVPAITGRIGLILTVRDPMVSARWYQDVFGFESTGQQTGVTGAVDQICLQDGISGFTLCLLANDQNPGDPFTETTTGLDHVEFFVASGDELDAWARWLDSLGVAHSGVKSPPYTANRMITFRDPDNIQLELFWEGPRG
jgi:catechol 2,3-dioxygenase-like lactoylglutathione lyase family enzyme